jgi:hypothetical protein
MLRETAKRFQQSKKIFGALLKGIREIQIEYPFYFERD